MTRPIRNTQLYKLISAHFVEIIREPGVLFWGILFPIAMAVGLGIAFTQKSDVVHKIAVIAKDPSGKVLPDSTSKLERFLYQKTEKLASIGAKPVQYRMMLKSDKLGSTHFFFEKISWQSAIVLLKRGQLSMIIEEKNGEIIYHFDPLNPDAQLAHLKLLKIFSDRDDHAAEPVDNIEPLTLAGTRYIDFLVPGLMAMGIMMSNLWGISYSIIEKRSKKLLRRMVATPMKKSSFLIALMVVRIGMNLLESTLLFIFAHIFFHITIQGNLVALFTIFFAGNLAFAGIAIFTSSRTANTEIGNGLINFVTLPMMVLSGIFFNYQNFPEWSIGVIQKLPLTLLVDGMRSIFNEAGSLSVVFLPTFILMAIGMLFFLAGLKLFRWH